ncbi:MAG TPA: TIM-barrel domain-containing protein, partial [Armatimonadota bacterium]
MENTTRIRTTPRELARTERWVANHLLPSADTLPFSFTYGDQSSAQLLSQWDPQCAQREIDAQRMQYVLRWTDRKTGLVVRCEAVVYRDYPVVEWTVYFTNTGKADTPLLDNIQGMDVTLPRAGGTPCLLRSIRGDDATAVSYQPFTLPLADGAHHRLVPVGGRPTDAAYPYFNLDCGEGQGVIAVVGWPGQWAANFACDAPGTIRVTAGQELTHLKVLPGETMRTPLSVLLFWDGDWLRAQNLWRHWMIDHNLPRPGGKLPAPFTSCCIGLHQSEETELTAIEKLRKQGIQHDYWWMDAGWYPNDGNWAKVGTWEYDPVRFPRGIKAIADNLHAHGQRLV